MTKEAEVPFTEKVLVVRFPRQCLYCGEPQTDIFDESDTINLPGPTEGDKAKQINLELPLPYCREHVTFIERSNILLDAPGFVVGAAMFVVGMVAGLGSPPFGIDTPCIWLFFALVTGCGAAYFSFLATSLLVRFILARFVPLIRHSSIGTPLGLYRCHGDGSKRLFTFKFHRDEYADRFLSLNGVQEGGPAAAPDEPICCPFCGETMDCGDMNIAIPVETTDASAATYIFCLSCGSRMDPGVLQRPEAEASVCWYCETRSPTTEATFEINMFGNVQSEVKGDKRVPTTWDTATVRVPRCETCANVHKKIDRMASWLVAFLFVGAAATGVGAGVMLHRFTSASGGMIAAVGIGAGLIAAGILFPIGSLRISTIRRGHGTRPADSAKGKYQGVRGLKAKGWEMGDKPSDAK